MIARRMFLVAIGTLGLAWAGTTSGAATNAASAGSDERFLGALYQELALGNVTNAVAEYEKLAESAQVDARVKALALFRLASTLAEQGRTEQATGYFRRIVETYPDQAVAQKAQAELKRLESARPGFDAVAQECFARFVVAKADEYNAALLQLTMLGDRALPTVLEGCKNRDSEVRKRAALALARFGDERAFPILLDIVAQEDSGSATIARKALVQLAKENARHLARLKDACLETQLKYGILRLFYALKEAEGVGPLTTEVARKMLYSYGVDEALAVKEVWSAVESDKSKLLRRLWELWEKNADENKYDSLADMIFTIAAKNDAESFGKTFDKLVTSARQKNLKLPMTWQNGRSLLSARICRIGDIDDDLLRYSWASREGNMVYGSICAFFEQKDEYNQPYFSLSGAKTILQKLLRSGNLRGSHVENIIEPFLKRTNGAVDDDWYALFLEALPDMTKGYSWINSLSPECNSKLGERLIASTGDNSVWIRAGKNAEDALQTIFMYIFYERGTAEQYVRSELSPPPPPMPGVVRAPPLVDRSRPITMASGTPLKILALSLIADSPSNGVPLSVRVSIMATTISRSTSAVLDAMLASTHQEFRRLAQKELLRRQDTPQPQKETLCLALLSETNGVDVVVNHIVADTDHDWSKVLPELARRLPKGDEGRILEPMEKRPSIQYVPMLIALLDSSDVLTRERATKVLQRIRETQNTKEGWSKWYQEVQSGAAAPTNAARAAGEAP
ncbi:MAG: HEAT repeat domain-containing protein [bacterium]